MFALVLARVFVVVGERDGLGCRANMVGARGGRACGRGCGTPGESPCLLLVAAGVGGCLAPSDASSIVGPTCTLSVIVCGAGAASTSTCGWWRPIATSRV